MRRLAPLIAAGLFSSGCDSSRPTAKAWESGEQLAVPAFSITITLDDEARAKLTNAGETIKAAIYFDGDGTPVPGVKTAPHRDVFLGTYEFELNESGTIQIEDATISAEAYSRLSDKDYHYTINVVSGRRSFENNVLDGGYAQGRHSELDAGKPIKITCTPL